MANQSHSLDEEFLGHESGDAVILWTQLSADAITIIIFTCFIVAISYKVYKSRHEEVPDVVDKRFLVQSYGFYGFGILHSVTDALIIVPHSALSHHAAGRVLERWCHSLGLANLSCTAMADVLLIHLLLDRVALSFVCSRFEVRKATIYVVKLSSAVLWASGLVISFMFGLDEVDHDHDLSRTHLTFFGHDLFLALTIYTVAIFALFLFKLNQIRTMDDGNHFFGELMVRQSVVMSWVLLTTALCFGGHLFLKREVQYLPIIIDMAANGIALFLTMSIGKPLYHLMGCHLFARCCGRCWICTVRLHRAVNCNHCGQRIKTGTDQIIKRIHSLRSRSSADEQQCSEFVEKRRTAADNAKDRSTNEEETKIEETEDDGHQANSEQGAELVFGSDDEVKDEEAVTEQHTDPLTSVPRRYPKLPNQRRTERREI